MSGEFNAVDIPGMRAKILELYAPLLSNSKAAKTFVEIAAKDLDVDLLSRLWSNPRGADFARRVAMGRAVFPDIYRVPVEIVMERIILDGTIDEVSANEEELHLITDLTRELVSARTKGSLSIAQIAGLVAAWNGLVDLNNWRETMKSSPPALRHPLEYVIARRLIRLGKIEIAREMLLEVTKGQVPQNDNGVLHKLASGTLLDLQKRVEVPTKK